MKRDDLSIIGAIERTDSRLVRWRVRYPGEGMDCETLHLTRLGARLSRWLWRVDHA